MRPAGAAWRDAEKLGGQFNLVNYLKKRPA
jgi:hypothetical protein